MATSERYRYYNKNMLKALIIGCVISIPILIIPDMLLGSMTSTTSGNSPLFQYSLLGGLSGVGLLILLAEILCVMVYDWRGAITLRGALKTQRLRKGKLVSTIHWYVLLYLFFPYVMLPIYLTRTVRDQRQAAQRKPLELKRHIAEMEAQLGFLPPAEGTCRACHKQLQIGAEFCPYCGVTVIARPKVCPSCATTTFPDAKWCPQCRTALP
jgi:RNA polymerase subunit RPABC4/transcription elongation factor Spt4